MTAHTSLPVQHNRSHHHYGPGSQGLVLIWNYEYSWSSQIIACSDCLREALAAVLAGPAELVGPAGPAVRADPADLVGPAEPADLAVPAELAGTIVLMAKCRSNALRQSARARAVQHPLWLALRAGRRTRVAPGIAGPQCSPDSSRLFFRL